MAITPGLKKVGQFWHYSLTVNGQRRHGSTKAQDLATARIVLEEKRKELLIGHTWVRRRVPTFAELFREWVEVNKRIHSPRHIKNVESYARIWLLRSLGGIRIDRLSTMEVMQVRDRVIESGRSLTTANNLLRVIRLLVGYGIKMDYLERVPFRVTPLRVQRKPRPVLTGEQVKGFLAAVDRHSRNPHSPLMVRVMLGLGLRESEVLGMRWEWFDPLQRTYVVGRAKGTEARVLPVPQWLWERLNSVEKPVLSEWVFPSADGKPHRANYCRKVLTAASKELKVGKLTQHRLRASFATLHAKAGTPLPEIQSMLGHKCITTTMIYIETDLEAKRTAQENLSMSLGF